MLSITDSTTDPYWNLAAEEFIIGHFREPVFRLWRNSPAVIIGRNQNAATEINRPFVQEHGIAVVRRLSGGGAVFHDLGNVNFTFVDEARSGETANGMFRRFTAPIIGALRKMGIDARLEGRNDIVIYPERAKISGNAMCLHHGRVLQHGTLLFNARMSDLTGALLPRPEKYRGRGVQSVRSRVTNICDHLPSDRSEMRDVEVFMDFLQKEVTSTAKPYIFSRSEIRQIEELVQMKYRTERWNWGADPADESLVSRCRRFDGGIIEATFAVKAGKISNLQIHGDYFFTRPTEDFCTLLEGCPYDKKSVTNLLGRVTVEEWFSNISSGQIVELLLD